MPPNQRQQFSLCVMFTLTTACAGLFAVGHVLGLEWLICSSVLVLLCGTFFGMALTSHRRSHPEGGTAEAANEEKSAAMSQLTDE